MENIGPGKNISRKRKLKVFIKKILTKLEATYHRKPGMRMRKKKAPTINCRPKSETFDKKNERKI